MANNLGNKETMAKNIAQFMARDKMERNDLVAALGEPYTTVTDWINGKTYPRIDKIEKMAQIFGVAKADLIEEQGASADVYNGLKPQDLRIAHAYQKADPPIKRTVEVALEPYMSDDDVSAEMDTKKAPPERRMIELPKANRRKDGKTEVKLFDQPAAAGLGNYLDEPTYEVMEFRSEMVPDHFDFAIRISGDSMVPYAEDKQIVFINGCPEVPDGKVGIFILNGEAYCKRLKIDKENREVRLVSDNKKYKDIIIKEGDVLRTVGRVV